MSFDIFTRNQLEFLTTTRKTPSLNEIRRYRAPVQLVQSLLCYYYLLTYAKN